MAPNLQNEDDPKAVKPSGETAVQDTTVDDPSKQTSVTPEPKEPDYRVKFAESTRENQRILDENKKIKDSLEQYQDVMDVLNENPDLLTKAQEAWDRKYGSATPPSPSTGVVADKVVKSKVQEEVAPLARQLEELQKERLTGAVRTFTSRHPDAGEGSDVWQKVLEWLPAMKAKGLPIEEGLERAYEFVTINQARSSGKTEALKELFLKDQASAGGGASASALRTQNLEESLTPEEIKVAEKLGISPKAYAKRKASK